MVCGSGTASIILLFLNLAIIDQGQITKSGNNYMLIINRQKITNILMFSDRPARLTKRISLTKLEELWKTGKNSFLKDPPNAAVVVSDNTQTDTMNFCNNFPVI